MNKSDIYKIIGYNGEYSNNVKKALRKLLKENHPDIGGNINIFKLINEVKKELEDNKVSFHSNKENSINTFDDIDYDFCTDKKKDLENKKNRYQKELEEIKQNINIINSKYDTLYHDSMDKQNILYNDNSKNINKLLITICFISIVLLFILSLIIITKKYILLIIFIIILIFLLIYINNLLKKIKKNNNDKVIILNNYFDIIKEINNNVTIKKELYNRKIDLENKITKINNDIRFYNNILKMNKKKGFYEDN